MIASPFSPAPPASLLRRLPPAAAPVTDLAGLPRRPGAYLLLLRLDGPATLDIATLGRPGVAPGWYVYAGSARGPGGIAARLGRHLAGRGKPRWHVDRLNALCAARLGLAYPEGHECDLVAALIASGGFASPLPRFGASDCRACPSHLLRWERPTAGGA